MLIRVIPQSIPSNIKDEFDDGVAWLETWEVQPWTDPPIDPRYGSAYDVVGDGVAYNNLWSYAEQNTSTLTYSVGLLVGWGFTISNWVSNANPTITFTFNDGSSLTFKLVNFDPVTGDVEVEFSHAVDGADNPIYEDAMDLAGDSLNPVLGDSVAGYFDRMGVTIAGTPVQFGTCYEFTCEPTPTGVECEAVEVPISRCF